MRAGYCTKCDKPVWRTAEAQRDKDGTKAGTVFILWPDPTSLYARLETESGYAPGIAYCQRCAPAPLTWVKLDLSHTDNPEHKILDYEKAPDRYRFWYTEGFGTFLPAWLKDHLTLDDTEVVRLLTLWNADRHAAQPVSA